MAENKFTSFIKRVWAAIKRTAKRVWEYLKVAKMEWIVMISLFALDLITKSVVANTVDPYDPVELIPGFLQINYTTNEGAAYGSSFMVDLLTPIGARIFFSVFAVAASVAFVLILIRNKGKNKLFRIGIAMFVAGAMGNCIDRMFLGVVRDFIHFMFQKYIFNIADAELIFGVVLIVIYLLFFMRDDDKKSKMPIESSDAGSPSEARQDGIAQGAGSPSDEQASDETALSVEQPPDAERQDAAAEPSAVQSERSPCDGDDDAPDADGAEQSNSDAESARTEEQT